MAKLDVAVAFVIQVRTAYSAGEASLQRLLSSSLYLEPASDLQASLEVHFQTMLLSTLVGNPAMNPLAANSLLSELATITTNEAHNAQEESGTPTTDAVEFLIDFARDQLLTFIERTVGKAATFDGCRPASFLIRILKAIHANKTRLTARLEAAIISAKEARRSRCSTPFRYRIYHGGPGMAATF